MQLTTTQSTTVEDFPIVFLTGHPRGSGKASAPPRQYPGPQVWSHPP